MTKRLLAAVALPASSGIANAGIGFRTRDTANRGACSEPISHRPGTASSRAAHRSTAVRAKFAAKTSSYVPNTSDFVWHLGAASAVGGSMLHHVFTCGGCGAPAIVRRPQALRRQVRL